MKLLTIEEVLPALQKYEEVEYCDASSSKWKKLLPECFSLEALLRENHSYRIAPEKITIGDVSFPKPVSEPLEIGQEYFVADIIGKGFYDIFEWENRKLDQDFLKYGMIHLTRDDAVAHAKALIKLSEGDYK